MNELTYEPVFRIYGVVFFNFKLNRRIIRLTQEDNLEEAIIIIKEMFRKEKMVSDDWWLEGWASLDIIDEEVASLTEQKIEEVVENKGVVENKEKKVEGTTFINNLQLARDRFTQTTSEKKIINKIIERIKDGNTNTK